MNPIFAETKRLLETGLAFVASSVLSVRLPLDTSLKGILIRLSGTVTYTFASAPSALETSIFDNLVSRIEVVAGGERTVCNVKPHMNQILSLYARGIQPERRASAAAAAAYANNPLADSGMTFGSTTQTTTILEALYLPFECTLATEDEQSATWLNTRGLPSCELRMYTNTLSSLDRASNATFTGSAITFEISTVEAKDFNAAKKYDWKRTCIVDTVSAQVTERRLDLPRGNKVSGVGIFAIQDSSGADGTAANRKKPNNNSVTDIKFRLNGREIYSNTFRRVFSDNQVRGGMNAAFAASISRRDGWAFIDFLQNKRIGTALDTRGANAFEILYSTRASDASNNIYPLDVAIETHEIVEVA